MWRWLRTSIGTYCTAKQIKSELSGVGLIKVELTLNIIGTRLEKKEFNNGIIIISFFFLFQNGGSASNIISAPDIG